MEPQFKKGDKAIYRSVDPCWNLANTLSGNKQLQYDGHVCVIVDDLKLRRLRHKTVGFEMSVECYGVAFSDDNEIWASVKELFPIPPEKTTDWEVCVFNPTDILVS